MCNVIEIQGLSSLAYMKGSVEHLETFWPPQAIDSWQPSVTNLGTFFGPVYNLLSYLSSEKVGLGMPSGLRHVNTSNIYVRNNVLTQLLVTEQIASEKNHCADKQERLFSPSWFHLSTHFNVKTVGSILHGRHRAQNRTFVELNQLTRMCRERQDEQCLVQKSRHACFKITGSKICSVRKCMAKPVSLFQNCQNGSNQRTCPHESCV